MPKPVLRNIPVASPPSFLRRQEPKQQSTGGVPTLLGISKQGGTYLRTLLIHGGRTVVRVADKHDDRRNNWIKELDQRRGKNISAVAVANKNARIAWAVLTKKEPYKAVAPRPDIWKHYSLKAVVTTFPCNAGRTIYDPSFSRFFC